MSEGIKKYHLEKKQPESPEFGLHHFVDLERQNLCLSQQPHNHSFYQIIWFKNNGGRHFIDFSGHEIKEDTLFFVAKNQVHFFEQNIDYQGLLIHFNESFIISNEADVNFFLTYHIFNNQQRPYFRIPAVLKQDLSNYLNQIEAELAQSSAFGNSAILSNLLKSMLLLIEREIRKELGERPKREQNDAYLRFRGLLEQHFNQGWSVAQYADALAMSSKTLNNLLKAKTGQTVSETIQDRIILEAKRQLTHTNALVNDIAYDLGFQDPYYFIRYFKKHARCTPSEFRASISDLY